MQVVEDYIATQEADAESLSGEVLPPRVDTLPIGMRPATGTMPIMMSPSPMGVSHSMAAGSYREAVAASFRDHHISFGGESMH